MPEEKEKTLTISSETLNERVERLKKARAARIKIIERRRRLFYNMPTYQELLDKILSKEYPRVWQKPALCMLAVTGARVGELIQIQKRDVKLYDMFEKEMVAWSSDWRQAYRMDITLKTEKNRKTPIRVVPILRNELFSRAFVIIVEHWCKFKFPDSFLFSTHAGTKPLPRRSINKLIKSYVDPLWYPHLFRHYMVSNEVKAGINPAIIKQKAGWSDLRPHDVYAHLDTSSLVEAQRKNFGDIKKTEPEPIKETVHQESTQPQKTIQPQQQKITNKKTHPIILSITNTTNQTKTIQQKNNTGVVVV